MDCRVGGKRILLEFEPKNYLFHKSLIVTDSTNNVKIRFSVLRNNITKMVRQCGHQVHDDVIKWKHFPRYWTFVRGIHWSPVISPHEGQWRGTLMFSLICAWINGWVNNRGAGDLRRNRDHYDVTVMLTNIHIVRQSTLSSNLDCATDQRDMVPTKSISSHKHLDPQSLSKTIRYLLPCNFPYLDA